REVRQRHRRVEDRGRPSAVHALQQVVRAFVGASLDRDLSGLGGGDAESQVIADGNLRVLAADDALQVIEAGAGTLAGDDQRRRARVVHTIPSRSWTSTTVPASTLPVASSRMMKQLASLMDFRIPEPCSPVGFTASEPSAPRVRTPRWNSVRPG